jgi:hypothetical protein
MWPLHNQSYCNISMKNRSNVIIKKWEENIRHFLWFMKIGMASIQWKILYYILCRLKWMNSLFCFFTELCLHWEDWNNHNFFGHYICMYILNDDIFLNCGCVQYILKSSVKHVYVFICIYLYKSIMFYININNVFPMYNLWWTIG